MASIYDLKSRFQDLLRPVCALIAKLGISANQVTIAAIVLSAIAGGWQLALPQSRWPFLLLPLILLVRMALNAIDGMLAREFNLKSNLGAMLNEIGDVIADVLLYIPLALIAGMPFWGVMIVVIAGIITEMIGVVSVQIGGSRRYDGPMGKSDRALFFGTIGFVIGLGVSLLPWINWVFAAAIILSLLTGWNRAKRGLNEAKELS
ncbi:MAG: CDP-alcohol phosphatidyltransferase family protein [Cohaesibacteraceae bacterium]|nr:CDP-alcohol phosphatidyltransferase family protein [Cohaesibacteraceae bacterium]MBL4876737.1 CDP-alcohol phosphatidyltransferase family protein [Cohaesibacteraceae bacterium]